MSTRTTNTDRAPTTMEDMRTKVRRRNATIADLQRRLVAARRSAAVEAEAGDTRLAIVELYPEILRGLAERAVRTRRVSRQQRNLEQEATDRNLRDLGRFVAKRYRETYGREPETKYLDELGYEVKAYEEHGAVADWILERAAR